MGKKSKRKRQGHPARVSPLRVLSGGGEPNARPPADPFRSGDVPLEGRPEYEAQMAAWHEAGCP